MKNQVAWLTGVGTFEMRDEEITPCGPGEILVKNEHMGICGSDLFFFGDHAGEIAAGQHKLPILIGHECAGVVAETGPGVVNVRPGDPVALEPGVPCGHCEFCRGGRYNLCPDVDFMAAPPFRRGALQRYVKFPAHMAFKLPAPVDTMAGALVEPLAIGIHSSGRSGVGLGDTVVILGAGCIGLTLLLSAKARGAARVILVDLHDNRLAKATELGAWAVINSQKENVTERVAQLLAGDMPNFVFEAAGAPATVQLAAQLVKRGGTILLVGSVNRPTALKLYELTEKEANILFSFRYANQYPRAIEAVASGQIDIKSLVTHVFDFEDVQRAFEMAEAHKQEVVKAVIRF